MFQFCINFHLVFFIYLQIFLCFKISIVDKHKSCLQTLQENNLVLLVPLDDGIG